MINKFLLVFIFAILTKLSFACEIHLPHHLLVIGPSHNFNKVLIHTGCESNAIDEVNLILNSFEGKISSVQFSEMLKSKKVEATFSPDLIQVQNLKHLIREQLPMPAGIQLQSSEVINSVNYLSLERGDKIVIDCPNCHFGSDQSLNLNIVSSHGEKKLVTIKATFKKMTKAYKFISFLPAFSEISSNFLQEEFIESIPQTDLFTSLDMLKFYKLNKPVRSGEYLKMSDLNSINLVRAGLKTEVIIENTFVKLKTSGISRSNGTLGQLVEVFHPQKNKKYLGKVIDINKVLVEL